MNIFNILITILAVIIVYIILKKYNSKKNEKFTSTCTNATASLTDWERLETEPTIGTKLTNSRWDALKTKLSESNKNIVSLSFKDDLFKDMNDVEYYKIDINDYLEINKNGSIEYWKPIKKWKEGVVSHFCKELCILRLGYEWIKVNNITNLSELSTDIGTEKTDSIRDLIRYNTNNEYAKLDETALNDILGSYYINDNNYIAVDGINYKVAANIPVGRKWKVYTGGSYSSSEKDAILTDVSDPIVSYFYGLTSNIGDTIILSEDKYFELFDGIDLTEKYVIRPNSADKCFMPELFDYDSCYHKSCAIFANREFDDYIKLINLRESIGFKTSSFEHTTDIMNTSDNKLLNLVDQLQEVVNDRRIRDDCSYSLLIDKLVENIKVGDYVKHDDSINPDCPKTYDPHTYIRKPTLNVPSTYTSICDDLDVKEYRRKINPEIYKYITEEWIQNNPSYNLEETWDDIKGDIDLSIKDYNNPLKDKIISKSQLSELIVKYLDDVEYFLHVNYRKPGCFDNGYCDGSGIIIQNPNTKELMDSKNNKLNENDVIDLYTNEVIYYWQEVSEASNAKTIPSYNLGQELSNGKREFTISEWDTFNIDTITRYDIFEYNEKYYKYIGLLPRYIKMGKVAPDKYVEITSDNIDKINIIPDSNYITKSECNDQVINMIDQNKTQKLDKITELTNNYYNSLLVTEIGNISNLKDQILAINRDINTQNYDSLCSKYDTTDYKLYSNYNIIKFTKNTSSNTLNKINLSDLAQKTIKLKEISDDQKNKKFNKDTEQLVDICRSNECRNFGNITDQNKIDILTENTVGDIITISLNDFSRLIDTVNILENDYILVGTIALYKILSIYDDNIVEKINSDFSRKSYPDVFSYTYNDFISINIDLHRIDITADYYIIVNDIIYDLNIDDLFKRFISNYKSVYEGISNITLTNHEKCLNNLDELLFANKDAIKKGENSCTEPDYSCKENKFVNQYTRNDYDSMAQITAENKESWLDNFLTDYNDTYKSAIGYDIAPSLLDNTHANYWKNRYHNEEICPPSGTGKPQMVNGLYNVNSDYNYGLKWKKLPSDIDISSKTIIEIYDYDVINTSLDSTLDIIDLTSSQNNIRFKNSEDIIINMSEITKDYYLMITYVDDDESEFSNYYEVFGTNKCSNSQICSTKSNTQYMAEFNEHIKNIYNDMENCSTLNTEYADRYSSPEQTSFEKEYTTDFELFPYYPKNYDSSFSLYQYTNDEQTLDEQPSDEQTLDEQPSDEQPSDEQTLDEQPSDEQP